VRQRVADASLAADGDAGEREVPDVPVDGPFGDLELGGDALGGDQAAPAEELDQLEESVGAAHRREPYFFAAACHRARTTPWGSEMIAKDPGGMSSRGLSSLAPSLCAFSTARSRSGTWK